MWNSVRTLHNNCINKLIEMHHVIAYVELKGIRSNGQYINYNERSHYISFRSTNNTHPFFYILPQYFPVVGSQYVF